MSETWELDPLIGVGPLRFGMSRDEVATLEPILGPIYAEFSEPDADNGPLLQQARDLEAPIIYFRTDRLTGIRIQLDLNTKFNIVFKGVSVFGNNSRDVLIAFENANGGALYGLGAVQSSPQFWEQFAEKIPKVVNIEMANAYDPFLDKYQTITFKES
ncbi:hypothetical protein [Agrobacterium rubi]|uniref:Uncharacterized protein n=1 Tax=Agrobacterium rubi TaxID=28099 RepID=A0AAE7R7G3_9HYPH|nr:hypothetical protein [Agrobacterium rubi]NTE87730.1 hypothetical protein [Agrobacterium rubi]NTF05271.1 hypothetical protein [Agrobacterium rubi]NTF37824.1 hypothetical protein [Agrobacterium rubi]OCJ54082.1 hypothetical protein A6U92_22360 [Agrobacterium rubi]QTG01693.1 hypothetical protein G6M88_14420 [Agrobacterium rubi]